MRGKPVPDLGILARAMKVSQLVTVPVGFTLHGVRGGGYT